MNRRLAALQAIAAVAVLVTAAPAFAAAPASQAPPTEITVAIRFATDRTHAPSGEVTDIEGDRGELARLKALLDQSDDATTLLLIDPATRQWLGSFIGTPLEGEAADLVARADSRAHTDTVFADVRIDKLVASRISEVAGTVLTWSASPTVVYLPASLDAKTDAFLAGHAEVLTVLPQDDSPASATVGVTVRGTRVAVRNAALESCVESAVPTQCVRSKAGSEPAPLVVTAGDFNPAGSQLRGFLDALRTDPRIVMTSVLPSGNTVVDVSQAAASRKFPVPLREPLVLATRQIQAVAELFPQGTEAARAQQSLGAAVSDTIDAGGEPMELVRSALSHTRSALGRVRVVTSGRFTVSGDTAEIPVTVLNDSKAPVTVAVTLTPDSPDRLAPVTTDAVTIDPGARTTVPVRIAMKGLGTVGATIGTATASGIPLGTTARVSVTTTAYQEFARNIVWAAFALLALLAANNWRTRRRR